MSDLDAMTPEDVRAFHRQWYTRPTPPWWWQVTWMWPRCVRWPRSTTAASPRRRVPARKPRPSRPKGLRRIGQSPGRAGLCGLAFRRPAWTGGQPHRDEDRDALALMVLSAVLNGYDGARLDRALTQGPNRVADSASSSAMVTGAGRSQFMLSGALRKPQQVEDALRAEVARMAKEA